MRKWSFIRRSNGTRSFLAIKDLRNFAHTSDECGLSKRLRYLAPIRPTSRDKDKRANPSRRDSRTSSAFRPSSSSPFPLPLAPFSTHTDTDAPMHRCIVSHIALDWQLAPKVPQARNTYSSPRNAEAHAYNVDDNTLMNKRLCVCVRVWVRTRSSCDRSRLPCCLSLRILIFRIAFSYKSVSNGFPFNCSKNVKNLDLVFMQLHVYRLYNFTLRAFKPFASNDVECTVNSCYANAWFIVDVYRCTSPVTGNKMLSSLKIKEIIKWELRIFMPRQKERKERKRDALKW